MNERGVFVNKDETKHLVTGPVAIPDCPDCDFANGEPPLTADKIEEMAHWFNTKSRMSDPMHLYAQDGKTVIGETVESWTTKEVTKVININGKSVMLPVGTWMTTVKVTDDDTWHDIENGTLRGFSAMYVPREQAEQMVSKRTLIADLEDPVPLTVSIVDHPCVPDAIFTSIKAGRRFSNATLNKINKVFETMKAGFDEVSNLISIAENERQPKESVKEDIDMDKEELREVIKEETRPLWAELESLKNEEPEPEPEEPVVEDEPKESEPVVNEELEAVKTELEALKKKIGEREGNSIKHHDAPTPEEQTPQVIKGEIPGRDAFGRAIKTKE